MAPMQGRPSQGLATEAASARHLLSDRNLHLIFAITLMAVLGVASVTPAFPNVIATFELQPASVGLLVTVFTLPGVFLTPVFGVLADRLGRKRVLVPSLLLFGAAGSACGFASSFEALLAMRLLQGVGAAALGSLNVTLIGDCYEGRNRAAAMGYNASVLSVGTAAYPAIGGALALLGWNYPFFLPVLAIPLGVAALLLLRIPEPRSAGSLWIYLRNVIRSFDRRVAGLFIVSTGTFILLYGSFLTYFPILITSRWRGTSFAIGVVMSSMSIVTAATSSQLGRIATRLPERSLIAASFLAYGIALLAVPFVPGLAWLLVPVAVFGIGHGINIPCVQTCLARRAPLEHRAAFMAANGMVLRLGQTVGPLVMGACFGVWGISAPFLAGALLALILALVAWVLVR